MKDVLMTVWVGMYLLYNGRQSFSQFYVIVFTVIVKMFSQITPSLQFVQNYELCIFKCLGWFNGQKTKSAKMVK